MKQCVVFSTPGLIPIESFTVLGMNAKPNSDNPFGIFGTGLKLAIAVCLRMGQEVVIWRGLDKYTFYTKAIDFRGKEFSKLRMKKETWSIGDVFKKAYVDLPFTTEFGKHWELWQAFREFQTNTMDENGFTQLEYWDTNSKHVHSDRSLVVVTGQKFLDEYHDRERNFLPDGLTVREGSDRIQVLERPSKHVYYRGVRVMDLKEEAMFTYNFVQHVELTEDRTAKYPFLLEAYIAEHLMSANTKPEIVHQAVAAPRVGSFERSLSYRHATAVPSATFVTAATQSPNEGAKAVIKAREHAASTTILMIRIPRPNISKEEMDELNLVLEKMFGEDLTIEVGGDS